MNISDENNPAVVKSTKFQEMGGNRKFGQEIRHNRRVLGVINQNMVADQGFLRNHAICEKNRPIVPLHRPITRKFAAQMASTQQHPAAETNGFGDCIFIDADEEKETIDHIEPMFLEQTEEMLNEMDQMKEVEMEDVIEEPIMDIDGIDAKNPLSVVEYVDDLYAHYRKMESFSCVAPNYMVQQSEINEKMRAILIDWIIEVHDKFELLKETLFLTINIIDRFLAQQTVARKKLQLVGLVAILLSCKYEEVSVPIVSDLIVISDNAYTRKEVLEMERLMLKTLQFNMSVPTPYVFMKRFLKAAQSDKKLELLSFFLIELSLVEYEMLKFAPSLLAATAVYTAQCTLYGSKQWSKTYEWHSNYSENQLWECSRMMVGFHQKAGTGKLTGVYRKYCTSKFGFTAKCEPAHILLKTQF